MERCYVKAYYDWIEQTEALTDAERGRLFVAILEYARSGEVPESGGREMILFPVFRSVIDRDSRKAAVNAGNGAKGGRPRKAEKAQETEGEAEEIEGIPSGEEAEEAESLSEEEECTEEKPNKTENNRTEPTESEEKATYNIRQKTEDKEQKTQDIRQRTKDKEQNTQNIFTREGAYTAPRRETAVRFRAPPLHRRSISAGGRRQTPSHRLTAATAP